MHDDSQIFHPNEFSSMSMIDDVELSIAMSNFENSSSNYFFQHEIKDSSTCGGGASAIVARAVLGPDVSLTSIHPKDVSFHITTCKFVQLLSRREQHLFSEIISLTEGVVAQCLSNQKEMSKSSGMDLYLPSQLPTTFNFIDCTYIRGKFALLQSLPCPSVKKVMDHGYVSVVSIVSHLLALSREYRCIMESDLEERCETSFSHLSESAVVTEVLNRAVSVCGTVDVVVLLCIEWSNDFDPATSTKQNCRSCWIKTVTILPFCYSGKKVGESSTFPITIGRRNEDHKPVEK